MKRESVFMTVFLIILVTSLSSALEVQSVEASGTVYIRADGSIDPPTASISTVDNVTYTLTADINDQSIFVERNNITIDGRGHAFQGSYVNFSYGISLSNVTSVTVENMKIEAFWYGIFVDSGSNHSIFGDNIANNVDGIFLQSSANDWIFENNITSNNDWGVVFFDSHNESLFRNNITNNVKGGVWLAPSFNDDISENNVANNMGDGIALDGYLELPTLESSTFGNKITNNDIKDNTDDGIRLLSSTDNTISGNKITLNHNVGISLNSSSSHNNISGNNITKSTHGIWLSSYSNHNSLTENRVTANSLEGIKLEQCFEMNIANNIVTDNNVAGLWLSFSNSSLISQNRIERNYPAGIILDISSNNTILENDLKDNHINAVFEYSVNGGVGQSSDNRIFHNNFINGTWNAVTPFAGQSENFWDDGYPSGGNYWSDYNGTDANNDGIGDTPHVIDANNVDHYPLMGMFNSYDVTYYTPLLVPHACNVTVISDSTISDFAAPIWIEHPEVIFLQFNVTGTEGSNGFCRVSFPTAMMNSTYHVFVSGMEVPCILLPCSNADYSYLYFTYMHSTKEVVIVPEFPSFLILPLFFIASLLAVIIYKRKHPQNQLPD